MMSTVGGIVKSEELTGATDIIPALPHYSEVKCVQGDSCVRAFVAFFVRNCPTSQVMARLR